MLFLFSITWGAVSGWWALACLALGLLYAWLLYREPVNLGNKFRYGLFAVRALIITLLGLILLSPLVKSISYNPQKPLVLVAQDNSQSVKLFSTPASNPARVFAQLSALKNALGSDYDVQEFHFDKQLAAGLSKNFNGKQTDIAMALQQLNERFVNQNIGAVVLATDGLYNQGSDPQYAAKQFKSPIYPIALGDTIAKRDLLIGNINYNKTAFLGNDFEIEVLAEAYQGDGETMHLTVSEEGREVAQQNIAINSAGFHKVVPVKLHADKKGLRKFTVSIAPVNNELSKQNNTEAIYIDILDAREKVLLLYNSPHPDISVIKQSIEADKNYDVKASLLSDLVAVKPGDYSLVILYQCASVSNENIRNLLKAKLPVWYIAGAQTDLSAFNNDQQLVKISAGRPDMQEVFAKPLADFTSFTLSDSTRDKISVLPPLLAPYGNYSSAPSGSVLLKQRIGGVETSYPLMAFAEDNGERTGVLTGEGLWRWQLAEYQHYGNHHALEELLGKAVQYLTANSNRQRFIVYASKHIFDEGENVLLNAELYNDALELINTPDVKLNLKSAAGKNYSFLFTRSGKSYQLDAGTLPVGEYSYTASANFGDRTFAGNGQLTVKPLNLELRQSAANHGLLNVIAKNSGGTMLLPSQIDQLAALIRKNESIKTVVYEDKRYSEIVDIKWVFALILVLLSLEWLVRKREGEV